MKNVYLRSEHSIKSMSLKILVFLTPLILAGFYKNGIKLYTNNLVGFYGLLKPILFIIIGFIIGCLVNIIYYKFKKNKDKLSEIIFSSFHPLYGVIIASVISINTNILLFIIITFIILLISKLMKEAKFNVMAFAALLIILIINLTGDFTFLNIYESSRSLNLNTLDYLLGMGSGGVNTSNILFLFISLIFLLKEDYYKKDIAIYSIIAFSILIILYSIYSSEPGFILENIFSYGTLFSLIFIAPDPISSSYTKKGMIIFGFLVGIITFGLYLLEPSLAALGAILIVSLLYKFIDLILVQKA
ncbi:MAG: RnfABCDGE type electron transport complex subunit D [Bacilli bacterium]|nr:RnfABCDGE type electron transport complex subunit D [Bacilli bacterium]